MNHHYKLIKLLLECLELHLVIKPKNPQDKTDLQELFALSSLLVV